MENLETIIKNASRRMKINNTRFVEVGGNWDYKPKILIYENGYIVGMYHSAGRPQLCHINEKIYDGVELGKHIVTCHFSCHVLHLKVQDIVGEINRQIEHEEDLQNEFDKINNISL